MKSKNVYIIAGPNGSGKTTFAKKFLPEYVKCPYFVNADLIAHGLSPFAPHKVAVKSGKLVLEQIRDLVSRNMDFGFETTLSGKTYQKHFKALKDNGYKLHLFFLWIPSSQLAIARVRDRVSQGGHNVPVVDIKRRYERSIVNFFNIYRSLLDKWVIFNNSGIKPELIAKKEYSNIDVINKDLFEKIIEKIGVEL